MSQPPKLSEVDDDMTAKDEIDVVIVFRDTSSDHGKLEGMLEKVCQTPGATKTPAKQGSFKKNQTRLTSKTCMTNKIC